MAIVLFDHKTTMHDKSLFVRKCQQRLKMCLFVFKKHCEESHRKGV